MHAQPAANDASAVRELAPVRSEPVAEKAEAAPATPPKPRPHTEPRPGHLLDVRSAAAWLGLSKSTLDKMRCYGVGPRFIRATGRAVRYDPADLRAFAEGRRQHSTHETVPDAG